MPRKILLLVLLAAVAGAVFALSSPGGGDPVVPPAKNGTGASGESPIAAANARIEPFTTASECAVCHASVYAEWKESFHGQAWTDPMVRALSNGFRMTECIDCHAPMPIHVTGVGQRVAPRQHSRGDGVDCLSCHLMDDGVSVAATRATDTSKVSGACRPVLVKEMGEPMACAGCHNQHQTIDELANSGVTESCSDCHMPGVPRGAEGAGGKGRSHRFPGAHSLEMHQKAVSLELILEAGTVVARVKNVGAGHHVPTDARHRSYNVFLSAVDERGNPLVTDKMIGEYRLYYRDDFRPSTQIAYGKTGEARWPIPEGLRGKAIVRLAYALNPEELQAKRVLDVVQKEISFP